MDRLAIARETRRLRGAILADLTGQPTGADARRLAAEHIDSPHPAIATLTVGDLIVACRGVGPRKQRKMTNVTRVAPTRRVGDLTDRERDALSAELRKPMPRERPAQGIAA